MNINLSSMLCLLLIPGILSCQQKQISDQKNKKIVHSEEFNNYWYSGKAEIDSYNLKQARYGEIHDGKAVLIYVTEPFSKSKQVKLDYPDKVESDNQTVLKLNFTKKFTTGIYPYSMMMSVFTPVEYLTPAPKITMSSQEWCGHVFSQLNLKSNKYHLSSYSYFEQEGDIEKDINYELLEDELWNLIRLDPTQLPIGNFEIIPGLFHTRLLHKELISKQATAKLTQQDNVSIYILEYLENKRTLNITFEKNFPHKIIRWEERIVGLDDSELVTSAELDKTINIDYWNRHSNIDKHLRDSLNLN